MKEWILHRFSSLLLIPACLLYSFYSNPYIVSVIYLVLCYHVLHGLLSIYEDYIQNAVYRKAAVFSTYLSVSFLFKVLIEMLF